MSLMLNINAMNYRASSSEEWSPLTIMANADISAIIEQFSTSNTYATVDYVQCQIIDLRGTVRDGVVDNRIPEGEEVNIPA